PSTLVAQRDTSIIHRWKRLTLAPKNLPVGGVRLARLRRITRSALRSWLCPHNLHPWPTWRLLAAKSQDCFTMASSHPEEPRCAWTLVLSPTSVTFRTPGMLEAGT